MTLGDPAAAAAGAAAGAAGDCCSRIVPVCGAWVVIPESEAVEGTEAWETMVVCGLRTIRGFPVGCWISMGLAEVPAVAADPTT